MQDGQFRGKNVDYKIGRAIFLFSGGISKTFDEFQRRGEQPGNSNIADKFKLRDFSSRLRGYLDIADINPGSYSVICWYGLFPIAPAIQFGGSRRWPQPSRARRQPR